MPTAWYARTQQHHHRHVTTERMSRTPDERLYSSGCTYLRLSQCYVTLAIRTAKTSRSPSATPTGPLRSRVSPMVIGELRLSTSERSAGGRPVDPRRNQRAGHYDRSQPALGRYRGQPVASEFLHATFIDENQDGIAQAEEGGDPFANVAGGFARWELEKLLLVMHFTVLLTLTRRSHRLAGTRWKPTVTRYKSAMHLRTVYDVGLDPPTGPDPAEEDWLSAVRRF